MNEVYMVLEERYSLNDIVAASRGEPLARPLTPRERWVSDYLEALHELECEYPQRGVPLKAYTDPNTLANEREW
jgi:hypothetical protein